jgi:hypothetical protein
MSKKKSMSTEKAVANVESNVAKALGRPSNPDSARQKKIADRDAKRAAGELKRGRPAVAGSKRQAVLAARAEKVAAGGTLSKGRPVNPNSKRQQELAAKTEGRRLAALDGKTVASEAKKGRPSRNSQSTAHEEVVSVEATSAE